MRLNTTERVSTRLGMRQARRSVMDREMSDRE